MRNNQTFTHIALFLFGMGLVCLMAGVTLIAGAGTVLAQDDGLPLHPTFELLDTDGNNVLDSGNPVSTMATCGTCHDTAFIAEHSVHADAGLSLVGGEAARDWQLSDGWYGEWNPVSYRYLSPDDLDLSDWLQTYGLRHVGGGPAEETGIEMNCFLCHLDNPDNDARIAELLAGNFEWASTATLSNIGLVKIDGDTWQYNAATFNTEGELLPETISLGEPTDANCGQCHGVVHSDAQIPFVFEPLDLSQWNTLTTGQVFSPQRISNSGMNVEDKDELARSWDVHAERAVNCVDCHYSLNNPIFYIESETSRPDHLEFDPRRMDFDDYLVRPLHQFANGGADYADVFPVFERATRDCASCHDAVSTHTWLPYADRHTEALACETCHIPELNAPALESVDWTVLDAEGRAVLTYRGLDTSSEPALLTGYQPVLLPQTDGDKSVLAPYNVVSAWYWVYGEPAQPVPLETLQAAWFSSNAAYGPEILAAFDSNNDGRLDDSELVIDTEPKETLIIERLVTLGIDNPRIAGDVEAYAIHHNVTHGEWAISDCETCHSNDSRLTAVMTISSRTPGDVEPALINSDGATLNGKLTTDAAGVLLYEPQFDSDPSNLYILGNSKVSLIDWLGVLLFLGTVVGVMVHGGLRYLAAHQMPAPQDAKLREVYMYTIYERQWHWLQTVVIFGLIFTGLVIHKPDMFGMFSFRGVVLVHNALALILVVNAALAAFYHLVSGEIRQFLPEPRGFFSKMFAQTRYYIWDIFRSEPHPFEKTPQHKMNPIQQVTYFGLLNVLLPLQVITGALMWGVQQWPGWTERFGGLPLLAPFHSLIAWLLSTFIVLHVYMTTTGHTPLANIQAMIFGWDEVETHETSATGETE